MQAQQGVLNAPPELVKLLVTHSTRRKLEMSALVQNPPNHGEHEHCLVYN